MFSVTALAGEMFHVPVCLLSYVPETEVVFRVTVSPLTTPDTIRIFLIAAASEPS